MKTEAKMNGDHPLMMVIAECCCGVALTAPPVAMPASASSST